MKAVIYARVSTRDQHEHGYGLKYQIDDCQTYARHSGLDVIKVIKDDVSGAIRLEDRPGGQELLEIVASNRIGAVVVWRLDRLARPPKGEFSRLLTTIEHFSNLGVAVHDCDGGENDPKQLAGGLLTFIKGWRASDEREAIRKRTMRGKRERAKAGHWVGMFAPYGYDKVGERKNSRLVINEQETIIVRLIFEHYVGWGNREKLPVRSIAKMLNTDGIPTPGAKRNMKTRGTWAISNIRDRILKNPRYIGKIKSAGYVLDMPELAIIEPALFEEAQKQIRLNKRRHHRRKPTRFYLMSARFACHCGKAMVGGSTSVRNANNEKVYYPYYRCTGRYRDVSTGCCQTNLKSGPVDELVWGWVVGLLEDDEAIDEGLDELESRAREQAEPSRRQLTTIQNLLEDNKKKIRRLVTAFGNVEDETVAEAMQLQIKMIVATKDSLEREQEQIELKIANVEISPDVRQQIKALAHKVRDRLPNATNEDKQRLLDVLGLKGVLIELDDGGLAIKLSCILDTEVFAWRINNHCI